MADVTPSNNTLCGFLVPWAFSDSLAADHDRANDFDESDRRPRGVVPPASSKLALEPSGTAESAAANDYYVVCPRSGAPGPDGLGIAFATSSGGTYHGANKPTCLVDWERLYETSGDTEEGYGWDQLTLSDQTVVAVSWGHASSTFTYWAHTRTSAGVWSSATITTDADGGKSQSGIALTEGPDGELLAFYVLRRDGKGYIGCSRSTDNGATWRVQSTDVCGQLVAGAGAGTVAVNRVRAASNPSGQIVILVEWEDGGSAPIEHVAQFVSVDGGSTAAYVADNDGDGLLDIAVSGGRFVIATLDVGSDAIIIWRSADAFTSFWDNTSQALTDTRPGTENHGAAFLNSPDGVLYLYSVALSAAGSATDLYVHRSVDYGTTWQTGTATSIPVYDGGTAGLSNFDVSYARGYAMLCGIKTGTTGTLTPGDVYALYFGGHASWTLTRDAWAWSAYNPVPPTAGALNAPSPRSTDGAVYVPMESMANGWAANSDSGGSATRVLSAAGVTVTTGSGVTGQNPKTITVSNAGARGAAWAVFRVSSGTFTFQVSIGDGSTDGCDVEVSCTSTQISFVEQGGTHVYVNHNVNMSGGAYMCLYVVADAGAAKARYFYATASLTQPRTFTTGSTTTTGTSTNFVVDPQVEPSSVVIIRGLGMVEWDSTNDMGPKWVDGGFALTDLDGVPIGATLPTYLDDGIKVVGREGYAYGSADEWQIPIRGDRRKEDLLPSVRPSPRSGWRSGTTGSTWTLKYTFDTVNGAAMRVGSPLFGIFLDGLHGVGDVVVKDNGVSVGTATLSHSVAMTRAGNAVYPTESGTNAQGAYVEHDELVGGMVDLGSGDVRRISGNSAGALQSGATHDTKRAVIFLEDIDGTEAASGTFSVYPPRALILVREHGNWRRLDLEINSSNPSPSTYREIGIVAAGPIHVAGFLNSRQTTLAFEDGTTLVTMEDGTRRSVERHPTRRRAEVSWTYSPIDVRQIRNASSAAADYVLAKTGGSTPAAMRQDTPLLVSALYAGINGKSQPIVWIPYIEVGSATMTTYLQARAGECLYGRVTGPIRRERAPQVGLPIQSEAFTVTTVTVEEEL